MRMDLALGVLNEIEPWCLGAKTGNEIVFSIGQKVTQEEA